VRKYLVIFFTILKLEFFSVNVVHAVDPYCRFTDQAYILQSIANRANNSTSHQDDYRIEKLRNFLVKYRSPLLYHAESIVKLADENEIPWTLIVAIAGVESTFCRSIPKNSYNCWGWNNGKYSFDNYPAAIEIISKKMRLNYYNRGLTLLEDIGRVYAPPTPSWAAKVRYFMNNIENAAVSSNL